ncbi:hypothetical protein [Candidatus Fukatsuia endosymbiont of Tuberolachnus salignus]|uniref:hypothetical protein n=1 Tax=Candidatus Fukatsuia endosymbiont of Tuberolachnus salignus TaxID=3077957 RepID=UPI00313C282E
MWDKKLTATRILVIDDQNNVDDIEKDEWLREQGKEIIIIPEIQVNTEPPLIFIPNSKIIMGKGTILIKCNLNNRDRQKYNVGIRY